MKILMTADTVGGVWTYALELARALTDHDTEIVLFTMGRSLSPDQRAQVNSLPHVTLYETQFKLEWMENPWHDVRTAGKRLLEIEHKFSPDIIHLNGYAHAALPWSAPKLVVCHSCVLSWWKAVHVHLALDRQWDDYRRHIIAGLHAADFVIAPTRAMLRSIEECYGELHARTAVVKNALHAEGLRPAVKEPYIFSAGRLWDPAKNIAALERVAHRLDWPVYSAGDDLGINAAPNGACGKYRPLGLLPRAEIARWMGAASIYCAPARYEPFGLSILEAALSGCALVLGDLPSLRELWEGAAVFVNPTDHDAIACALNELIANPVYREKCARRARLRGLEFTPARMAAQYDSIYQRLLSVRAHISQSEARPCAS
jgi:glycogen synthase